MTDEQARDWEYRMICCLGISTSNSDINVVGLHKTVKELYEQGRADEREAQVCCGDYEKCMKACTPRGRWLAEKELAKPEQEPVCDKEPYFCKDCGKGLLGKEHIHTCSPQVKREWVGLTDDEIKESISLLLEDDPNPLLTLADVIQERLKEKNK